MQWPETRYFFLALAWTTIARSLSCIEECIFDYLPTKYTNTLNFLLNKVTYPLGKDRVFGLTLEYITKTSSLIGCFVGVGNLFWQFIHMYYELGGLVLILKGGLGTFPLIIFENNTEMQHKKLLMYSKCDASIFSSHVLSLTIFNYV